MNFKKLLQLTVLTAVVMMPTFQDQFIHCSKENRKTLRQPVLHNIKIRSEEVIGVTLLGSGGPKPKNKLSHDISLGYYSLRHQGRHYQKPQIINDAADTIEKEQKKVETETKNEYSIEKLASAYRSVPVIAYKYSNEYITTEAIFENELDAYEESLSLNDASILEMAKAFTIALENRHKIT